MKQMNLILVFIALTSLIAPKFDVPAWVCMVVLIFCASYVYVNRKKLLGDFEWAQQIVFVVGYSLVICGGILYFLNNMSLKWPLIIIGMSVLLLLLFVLYTSLVAKEQDSVKLKYRKLLPTFYLMQCVCSGYIVFLEWRT